MLLKKVTDLVIYVKQHTLENLHGIIGLSSFYLVINTITWQNELLRFVMGVLTALTSAYLVRILKKKIWKDNE